MAFTLSAKAFSGTRSCVTRRPLCVPRPAPAGLGWPRLQRRVHQGADRLGGSDLHRLDMIEPALGDRK
jgi:hypothetical protein